MWEIVLNLVIVLILAVGLTTLWVRGYRKQVILIVRALVIEAEVKYGRGTGILKYNHVIGLVYPKLPFIVRLLISEKALDNYIDLGVKWLKMIGGEELIDEIYGFPDPLLESEV